jgi:uncharacterized integral membrane protein
MLNILNQKQGLLVAIILVLVIVLVVINIQGKSVKSLFKNPFAVPTATAATTNQTLVKV